MTNLDYYVPFAKKFGLEMGYVKSSDILDDELIKAVLIYHREEIWDNYISGKISSEELTDELQISKDYDWTGVSFSSMCFCLDYVKNIGLIEQIFITLPFYVSPSLCTPARLYRYLCTNNIDIGEPYNKKVRKSTVNNIAELK